MGPLLAGRAMTQQRTNIGWNEVPHLQTTVGSGNVPRDKVKRLSSHITQPTLINERGVIHRFSSRNAGVFL